MSGQSEPLVSIVTPVFNGEAYLAECIESILAQTYSNWDYAVVDNCSTDGTVQIAKRYAALDHRVSVYENGEFLDIEANHNRAFRLITEGSKYCKVVSADDWLFPECIARLVGVAEANPSVGIVGSYQLSGSGANWRAWRVRWAEIPYPNEKVSGREISRRFLLGGPYVFGSPTSVLYRCDLVRKEKAFYPNSSPHGDTSACLKCLQTSDFGFVHQVLSYERIHDVAISTECREVNTYLSSWLSDLLEYGPAHLTSAELSGRRDEMLCDYYKFLAVSVFHHRGRAFWDYHRQRLNETGYPLSRIRLTKDVIAKLLDLLLNPKQTVEKVFGGTKDKGKMGWV